VQGSRHCPHRRHGPCRCRQAQGYSPDKIPSLGEALDELDARNQVAELSGLVSALRSAYQHGARAGMLVAAHADGLRAAERARLIEQGSQAMTRMVLPVGIFMLPVMAVVMIVPAVMQFAGLGS